MDVCAHSSASSGEILVYWQPRLSRVLIGMGLADELRLLVYPVVRGGGRVFGETLDKIALRLGAPSPGKRAMAPLRAMSECGG